MSKTISFFVCQRCNHPLRLDNSLEILSSQQLISIKNSLNDEQQLLVTSTSSEELKAFDQTAEFHQAHLPAEPKMNNSSQFKESRNELMIKNSELDLPSQNYQLKPKRFQNSSAVSQIHDNLKPIDYKFVHKNEDDVKVVSKLDQGFSQTNTISKDVVETVEGLMDLDKNVENLDPSCHSVYSGAYESLMDVVGEYALVGNSQVNSDATLSAKIKVIGELFDILSGQSEIDHPLCEECTDQLLDQLDLQLKQTEEESNIYSKYLSTLSSEKQNNEDILLDEIKQLKLEEEKLKSELEDIVNDHTKVQNQIEKEKVIAKNLQEQEIKYYKEYNNYKRQLFEFEDSQKSVENQLKYTKKQLDRLKKMNIFNITFHIWHKGNFGTINGFRLGRLPNETIEWNEINAGWGQVALLLYSLAKRIGLVFQKYQIVPYGNFSYIKELGDKNKTLPLYYSGGIKFFGDHKFDQAMVAFLDCLQQFKVSLEARNKDCCLPYNMLNGKIEDPKPGISYSIKLQFNSEEQWTKALKFMLTNLKWALVWVTSDDFNKKLEQT